MRTVELGHTGAQGSALSLGAMGMGTSTDEADSVKMLNRFLDAGGSFVDTADRNGWTAPVALQQQHSYLRPKAGYDGVSIVDPAQLDYLREHDDITLVAYSPILKGIYDDPAKRAGHWAMEAYAGPDAEARLAVVTEVAAELDIPPNRLGVAWLLHQRA